MGTGVRVVVTDARRLPAARRAVEAELEAVDVACSRFRPDSELSLTNAAAGKWVEVSPLFLILLEAAIWAARSTNGAVDPTVGGALKVIGYDRDFSAVVASDEPINVQVARVPGWRAIELDRRRRRVRLAGGAELDLGATAKALAADRAAEAALVASSSSQAGGVLVNLGGDISVKGVAPEGGWPVLVAEDHRAALSAEGEVVVIVSGGIATSSTRVRRWVRGGVDFHHIIDPATGLSSQGPWRSATVTAASCLEANVAATAAIVMGASAPEWLGKRALPARLVRNDGTILRLPGWPAST